LKVFAERLLNLLRLFEVYAADDALAFSLETLPFVDVADIQEMVREAMGDGGYEAGPAPSPSLVTHTAPNPLTKSALPSRLPPGVVLSTWISSLAQSLLAHLTRVVLPKIKSPLTIPGNAQLASDLAYLSNAIRALDVEWEELERWRIKAEAASGSSIDPM